MQNKARSLCVNSCTQKRLLNAANISISYKWITSATKHRIQSTLSIRSFCLQTAATQLSSSSEIHAINQSNDHFNNGHSHLQMYDYEIMIGPVVGNISDEKLAELSVQCSDQCFITKTRNSKALYIASSDENDIQSFQSLIHSQFLQHKTLIQAAEKIHFVRGPRGSFIRKLEQRTKAFVHLKYTAGEILIYGTKPAVDSAKKELLSFLSRIVFVELDNRVSFVCGKHAEWISRMKNDFECQIYSEPTGRLIIIAEPQISKRIIQKVQQKLSRAPSENEIKNKTVYQHKLKKQIDDQTNIGDVIRIVRNNHPHINVKNIHSMFSKLAKLREAEMVQEDQMIRGHDFKKNKVMDGQQRLEDALAMRQKKNMDYMLFMAKFARKYLEQIDDIKIIAEFVWCFAIFGIKRFDQNQKETVWPMFVSRLLELYKNDNNLDEDKTPKKHIFSNRIFSLTKCLSAFSKIYPISNGYAHFNQDLAFILKELNEQMSELDGGNISYALHSISDVSKNDLFMNLCRNCSFVTNIWKYLGNKSNYKNMDGLGHKNVSMILNSLCVLYPQFGENYHSVDEYQDIIDTVINLCDELFFFHESMEIPWSVKIISALNNLGFYESTLFDFLLPINEINKIDIHDALVYNKLSIHNLLSSFGQSLHLTHPVLLKKICKQFVEYRSTFSFDHYVEGIWSLLCCHFLSSSKQSRIQTHMLTLDQDEVFLLSKTQIAELFKTLIGRLADNDPSFMRNDIAIKMLQINNVCNVLGLSLLDKMQVTSWDAYKTMLRDGLQSELLRQYQEDAEEEKEGKSKSKGWDRNKYNILVLNCINSVLYGEKVSSDSFLMKNKYEMVSAKNSGPKNKRMQFDHVEGNGLIVDLCIDEREKRGIVIVGPNDVFIDNSEKMRGQSFMNYHLLTTYFDWDILCLNWNVHQTEKHITAAISKWFEDHNQKGYSQRKALSANRKLN